MKRYINEIKQLLDKIKITDIYMQSYSYESGLFQIVELLRKCKESEHTLYFCGNGGSAGIAQHMTADFFKNGGIRTYNMYGQSTITCISNDLTYDYVFCKQLEILAGTGDILIAISSSGESENIVKAISTMKEREGTVISLTGFKEQNRIRKLGNWNIYIPAEHYGQVESIHNLILQQIVDEIVETDGIAIEI